MMTDPLGDMLTRIRNGLLRRKDKVEVIGSRLAGQVLNVLVEEGYLLGWEERKPEKGGGVVFDVELKYHREAPVIREVNRVSRPGRRVYVGVRTMPRMYGGLGVHILSTSRGVMTGKRAREESVGGEILCSVF